MKLTISSKMAGVIIALCIPISTLTYLNVCEKNNISSISSKEIEGNEYLVPMMRVLQNIPKHKILLYKKKTVGGISDKDISDIRLNIEQSISSLESIDKKFGKNFHNISKKISNIKSSWSEIKNKSNTLNSNQIEEIHRNLTIDLRDLITYTGNISNLITDSSIDTSYLINITLFKIPALSDHIHQLQYLTENILVKKSITSNDKMKLSSLSALINSNLDEIISSYEMSYSNSLDKTLKNDLSDNITLMQNSIKQHLDYIESSMLDSNQKFESKNNKISELSSKSINSVFDTWGKVIKAENRLIQEKINNSDTLLPIFLVILFTLLSIILAIFIISGIVNAIKKINNAIEKNKISDFTTKADVKTGDELEDLALSFNSMIDNIHSLISDSEKTKKIVVNNSANFESLVKETSTSVTQIKQNSEVVSDNARIVAEAASISVSISSDGEKAVNESIEGVEQIKSQIEEVATKILELSAQTKAIGKIISTVDDISKQSRILAFNASIEASKAGEFGKGFAIVANEIKNLSEESKEATKKISTILNEIQGLTNKSVMLTEDAAKLADIGVNLSKLAGNTITKLVDSIQNSSEAAYQISSSAIEQKTSLEQLEESMRKISFVSKN